MNFDKKLLTLLAIFCVIVSAGVVCAADYDGTAGCNYQNMNGYSGSQYYVNEGKFLEPGNGLPLENQTGPAEPGNGLPLENQTGYVHVNSTGNATNTTANATTNVTHATGNTTNATATHTMPSTGNPIVLLLAGVALIGGYRVLKRNN